MLAVEKTFKTFIILAAALLTQACASTATEVRSHVRPSVEGVALSSAVTNSPPGSVSVVALSPLSEAEGGEEAFEIEDDFSEELSPYAAIEKSAPEEREDVVGIYQAEPVNVSWAEMTIAPSLDGAREIEVKSAEMTIAFSDEVSESELEKNRGGAFNPEVLNLSQLQAISEGNTVNNSVTGTNLIGENSLSNSSGLVSVIQNTGNNVVIQSSTVVNLNIVQ